MAAQDVQELGGAAPAGSTEMPEAVLFPGPWQPVAMSGIAWFVLFLLAIIGMSRLKKVPGFFQSLWEFVYDWVEEVTVQVMGPQGLRYFPLFLCFFLYILVSNLMGLFPLMASPTSKLDTTVALAVITFLSIHVFGMMQKGVFGYWGHFFHVLDSSKESGFTKIVMIPLQYVLLPLIELVGEAARPLSLSMRLFGNIFAKEILLSILASMAMQYLLQSGWFSKVLLAMPLILRPGILVLGVLVSVIQAVVFTALSMVYIGGAIAGHESHEEHGHDEHQGSTLKAA